MSQSYGTTAFGPRPPDRQRQIDLPSDRVVQRWTWSLRAAPSHHRQLRRCLAVTVPALSAQRPVDLRSAVAASQGRVIITLKSDLPGAAIRLPGEPPVSLAEQATIRARLSRDIAVQARGTAPAIAAVFATVNDQQLAELAQDPNVELVEPDVLVTLRDDRSMASIGRSVGSSGRADTMGCHSGRRAAGVGLLETPVWERAIGIIDSGHRK